MTPEEELRSLVAADIDPVLSDDEIRILLDNNAIVSKYATWAPNKAYSVGQQVVAYPRNGFVYRVTVAGTSGATQPAFPTLLTETVTDGGVTWEIPSSTTPGILVGVETPYNLRKAAAAGWLLKASKCVNRVDMKTEVHGLSRDQMFKHCMAMRKEFLRGVLVSVPVTAQLSTQAAYPVIGNVNPAP